MRGLSSRGGPDGRTIPRQTRPLAAEGGFTLVETLVAVGVLLIGIIGSLGTFTSSNRATLVAQRHEVAVHQAQSELEKLATFKYADLKLTAQPQSSTDPSNPGYRVKGTQFEVRPDLREDLVLASDPGLPGQVNPGPTAFTVSSGGSLVTGEIYRYVTWRDERCEPDDLCPGNQNTKRVTVAVTVDPAGNIGPFKPVWDSRIVADPNVGPRGTEQPPNASPGSGPAVTAQSFYLYDTRCGYDEPQPQTGDHATHDTASTGSTANEYSTCENSDASRQPDLMGPVAPPNPVDPDMPPVFKHSNDLAGSYPGGLAVRRRGTPCATSYSAADADNPGATSKWNVHAWTTKQLAAPFHLTGKVSLSFYTTSVGGGAGRGKICATLIDRATSAGVPTDTVLGSTTYDLASWPTTVRHLSFTFDLAQAADVAAGHRLALVLSVPGESDNDLVLLYDHPQYSAFVQVATTTPL